MVMTMLPPVAEIVLWLLSLSIHPPSSPHEQWHTGDTRHDGGVQCCHSFFTIQLQQQMRSHQTVYNMWMDEWRKRRCWWRKIIQGGGGSRNRYVTHVLLLMTVNHTHMHVVYTCSFFYTSYRYVNCHSKNIQQQFMAVYNKERKS